MSHTINYQPWLQAVFTIAKHYRIEPSEERIRLQLDWNPNQTIDDILTLITRQIGMSLRKASFSDDLINPWRLPVLVEFHSGQVAIIDKVDVDGNASVQFSGDQGLAQILTLEVLKENIAHVYILRPAKSVPDARVDEYIKPYESSWFWSIVLRDWKRYVDVMFASMLANILALATIVFSMNVYDRVIPAQSTTTLWVLAGGVLIAAIFEFSLKVARIYLSDIIGKRADLPFFFLFLGIFWLIGGNLFWLMLVIVPLMILPGLLAQEPLAKLANEGMCEGAIRNAMLIEAVQGIEDIKLFRAEARFQNQWNHMNEASADVSMRQRKIVGVMSAWTQKIQGLAFAIVVLVGAFAVMKGDMSTGALVAYSMLSSRMLGPIAQITGVLGRWQQAKVAKMGLDELMKKAVDQPDHAHLIHRPVLNGHYELTGVNFKYGEDDPKPSLMIAKLEIKVGEKIAILGRNGAGKSTLLQLLSGMQTPVQGKIKLDGVELGLIDPSDVRRDMALLNQNAHLFFGTVRENLTLGAPLANDEEILAALKITGAINFVQEKKEGLDHIILEGGVGFSGGQKQALLLSRLLIRQPNILLLDEPTASIDDVSEKQFIEHLKGWLGQKTLLVATHRRAVLELVDRIIVINDGKVVMDGPRDQVLSQNQQPQKVHVVGG